MAYILDGVLILILAVTVILGYRRGFVRSLVQLVGLVAAFVLAFSLSATISTVVYDAFVDEPLKKTVSSVLAENSSETVSVQVEKVKEGLPAVLSNAIDQNAEASKALAQLGDRVEESATALADTIVTDVVRPLVIAFFRFVLFLLLIVVLLLVVKLLTAVIKPLTKLPVIRQADGLLGAVMGLVKAALFILIAVSVMQLLASSATLITTEQLQESLIASRLAEINPVCANLDFI